MNEELGILAGKSAGNEIEPLANEWIEDLIRIADADAEGAPNYSLDEDDYED